MPPRLLLLLGFLLALPAGARSAAAQPPGSGADPHPVERVFLAGIAAFNRHDLGAFLQQWDADVQMYAPTGWLRGLGAVRERFVQTFRQFPHTRMEIRDLTVRPISADVAVVEFGWTTYPTGEGPAYHGVGTGVYVRRGERWVEVLEHESIVYADEPLPLPAARR